MCTKLRAHAVFLCFHEDSEEVISLAIRRKPCVERLLYAFACAFVLMGEIVIRWACIPTHHDDNLSQHASPAVVRRRVIIAFIT